jgi:hypothetical protein
MYKVKMYVCKYVGEKCTYVGEKCTYVGEKCNIANDVCASSQSGVSFSRLYACAEYTPPTSSPAYIFLIHIVTYISRL